MAMRVTGRSKLVVSGGLHPHYRDVVRSYLSGLEVVWRDAALAHTGTTTDVGTLVDANTACVVVQQPNFAGCIEALRAVADVAHAAGALFIVVVNEALSLALLASPGSQGADIVCGEAQSFGVPMSLGGPHVGFLASSNKHVRQMPGRLVGQTVDSQDRRGFVLTLSTREQHIRRERATSNICTNQGLCLLTATIYLCLMGRRGLRKLAELNLAKAEYAKARVRGTRGLALVHGGAQHFNEFAVRVPDSGRAALARALEAGAVGGLDLDPFLPELGPAVLVCTTELARRDAIDRVVKALAGEGA
jgi:glycine dehydrogenase subunit 1